MTKKFKFNVQFNYEFQKFILWIYSHSNGYDNKLNVQEFIEACVVDIAQSNFSEEYVDFLKDRKKKNKDGYVYLMTDNTNLFKIGFSKNPNDRLYQFQTGNPKISMYANYPANKLDEKLLHKLFKKKRDCREWFNLKPKDLKWIDNYFNNQNQ